MAKKIIIIGKGFLGTRIAEETGWEIYGIEDVNLLYPDQIEKFLYKIVPDIVINATGITGRPNVDWCEMNIKNRVATIQGNVVVPINLASGCVKKGIMLVHLSSGCIYCGDNNGKGFSEDDSPNFVGSLYSRTKMYSEMVLKEEFEDNILILRIRMPIDDRPSSRNYIDKVIRYKRVFIEQNSMTIVPDMIEVLKRMVENKLVGVYNLVNEGTISAFEVMTMYKEIVDSNHEFSAVEAKDVDTLAERSNCILRTDRLKSKGLALPSIKESVKKCLTNYKKVKR